MTAFVVHKPEPAPEGRFAAKAEIHVYVAGKYTSHGFRDPDESLTFSTESEVEDRIWQLATSWRNNEMPSADLYDDKGHFSRRTA
jgi:hypothetical protein